MWVWAVDPDYKSDHSNTDASSSSLVDDKDDDASQHYKGFLRVRLQQLVKNFYELRRFYDREWPMERLWQVSRRSKDQLFFSINEEDLAQSSVDRDVGSAIRAPGRVLRNQHGTAVASTYRIRPG